MGNAGVLHRNASIATSEELKSTKIFKYLKYRLGLGPISPVLFAKWLPLELGEEQEVEASIRAYKAEIVPSLRGPMQTKTVNLLDSPLNHNYEADAGWVKFWSKKTEAAKMENQVGRRHVAIGERLADEEEDETERRKRKRQTSPSVGHDNEETDDSIEVQRLANAEDAASH
ncbi:hypothetical protein HDU87_004059 [Geranomyces variabilis]|uniref:Uncharacterized protein n=1 Tax=Geranomyces variabilis TaxID=109894 RepID=A0AAD5TVT1_9FUNG|nr:hypothetical protein HDU87_004059 [Geranomyces variabilis]